MTQRTLTWLVAALVTLARQNALDSGLAVDFACADIFALPPDLKRDFDHVLVNPPFHGEGLASPYAARARALMDEGALQQWLSIGLQRTVSGGFLRLLCARTDCMRLWPRFLCLV